MSISAKGFPRSVLFPVFVVSGVAALIYQLVWQRLLLLLYGSHAESVAMVVASFLLGLGIGSLIGGRLSEKPGMPLVLLFCFAELGVAAYGLGSIRLFQWAGQATGGASPVVTALMAFALVFTPTLLMGATLPLLVAHQVRVSGHVGESVSWLYFVNTLGAAAGAFLTALWLLRCVGMSGSVNVAAALNAGVAAVVFFVWWRRRRAVP